MKPWKRPVLINSILVGIMLALSYAFTTQWEYPVDRFGWGSVGIVFLAFINLIVGMVRNRNRKPDGPYYLLMTGVLLLIGFSICSSTFL